MLFFPCGGKLKIRFRRTRKPLPERSLAHRRLPSVPAL